jgi:hypothetical protein
MKISKELLQCLNKHLTIDKVISNNKNRIDNNIYWSIKDELPSTDYFDYIIDGKFEIDKKSRDCPFRGSTNQRIYKL